MNRQEELPTLPIGTVLQHKGLTDREVIRSAPGLCLAKGLDITVAMGWLDGAWRRNGGGPAWKAKPEFQAEQRSDHSWVLRGVVGANAAVAIDARELPGHINPHAAAQAVADLLNGMANEVRP